jgi:hypothetical protein
MEEIRKTFKDYFKNWEIELPEQLEYYGVIQKAGWHIQYILEERNDESVVHVSASHRMTNDRNFTIKQNGEIEYIISGQSGYSYNPDIPGDKEKQEQLFYARNRKVGATHRQMGMGSNLRTSDLTTIILFNEYKKTKSFSSINEIYHPNYLAEIKFNQIIFKSLSHFYHYWKLIFSDEMSQAKELAFDTKVEVDFINGFLKKESIFGFSNKTSENQINQTTKWEENKLRVLLWGSILKFTQNKSLMNEILKFHEYKFIFDNNHNYWGAENNVLGYLLTHTCYDVYHLNWQDPNDK